MAEGIWIAAIREGFQDVPGLITMDVFTVGCHHRCPGCHTPDLQREDYPHRWLLTSDRAAEMVVAREGLVSAVCWMGGDPLFQPKALVDIVRIMRRHSSLPHVLFTGDEFEDMPREVLGVMDAAIVGPWKGIPAYEEGTNQRIMLSGRPAWRQGTKEELAAHLTGGSPDVGSP